MLGGKANKFTFFLEGGSVTVPLFRDALRGSFFSPVPYRGVFRVFVAYCIDGRMVFCTLAYIGIVAQVLFVERFTAHTSAATAHNMMVLRERAMC